MPVTRHVIKQSSLAMVCLCDVVWVDCPRSCADGASFTTVYVGDVVLLRQNFALCGGRIRSVLNISWKYQTLEDRTNQYILASKDPNTKRFKRTLIYYSHSVSESCFKRFEVNDNKLPYALFCVLETGIALFYHTCRFLPLMYRNECRIYDNTL